MKELEQKLSESRKKERPIRARYNFFSNSERNCLSGNMRTWNNEVCVAITSLVGSVSGIFHGIEGKLTIRQHRNSHRANVEKKDSFWPEKSILLSCVASYLQVGIRSKSKLSYIHLEADYVARIRAVEC